MKVKKKCDKCGRMWNELYLRDGKYLCGKCVKGARFRK